ncbi:hypothetical protein BC830DRAFT_1165170 [Chytriomyces sp. MP71]|nr:hypothetical protein BC830DRAFT_1165170 [Chytriomyces sp. MP71]
MSRAGSVASYADSASASGRGWESLVRVKLQHEKVVRQLVFDEVSTVDWCHFAARTREAFKLPENCSITAFYVDEDGDTIQVDSDAEIADVLNHPKPPKLSIQIASLPETPSFPTENMNALNLPAASSDTIPPTIPHVSPIPTQSDLEYPLLSVPAQPVYPSISEYGGSDAPIPMHDVESVAPESVAADSIEDAPSARSLDRTKEGSTRIYFDAVGIEEAGASNTDTSSSQQQEQGQPEDSQDREQRRKTIILDLSELIQKIRALADRVTRDPEFMNTAMRTLHEFAAASKTAFEDLFRLFNDLLASSHPTGAASTSSSNTSENPPRYSIVVEDGKAFVFRPQIPPQPPRHGSAWNPTFHVCTGITDVCRHLHEPAASVSAGEGLRAAAAGAREAASVGAGAAMRAAKEASRVALEASKVALEASRGAAAQAAAAAEEAHKKAEAAGRAAASAAGEGVRDAAASASTTAADVSVQVGALLQNVLGSIGQTLRSVASNPAFRGDSTAAASALPCWKHTTCDGCGKRGFTGPRYKCTVCPDFDLCAVCYFGEQQGSHEASHLFERLEVPSEVATEESWVTEKVNAVVEMGVADGVSRSRVQELVVAFGGDLNRVVEVLLEESAE